MAKHPISPSTIETIDRKIEDAVGRIMKGRPEPGDYCLVGDLTARRAELSEPAAFERIEKLLGGEGARNSAVAAYRGR